MTVGISGKKMRSPTENERCVILMIAAALPPDVGGSVKADLDRSTVEADTADGARLRFTIRGYTRPAYRGQHPYPVEGKMQDQDGADLHVILHADEDGHLLELEMIRWVGGPLLSPKWASFRLQT